MKHQYVRFYGVQDYEKVVEDEEDAKYSYSINKGLLRWEAYAFGEETFNMLFGIAGVVIFIIIFTSVFCIRNSFAISITEKMKMYGELASVGATKKQIRKSVIDEAIILGTIRCATWNIIWTICNFCSFKNSWSSTWGISI